MKRALVSISALILGLTFGIGAEPPELINYQGVLRAAACALNADHLDGNDSSYFLNTTSTSQTKLSQGMSP